MVPAESVTGGIAVQVAQGHRERLPGRFAVFSRRQSAQEKQPTAHCEHIRGPRVTVREAFYDALRGAAAHSSVRQDVQASSAASGSSAKQAMASDSA